jgi:hypothetical protein
MTTKIVNGERVDCTAEEIAALETERQEYASTIELEEIKLNRAMEYPSLAEQLDYIYHNGIDAWKADMIEPVKTKYPKPTE